MRNISAASLAALQQTSGLEPVIVVRVWWGGTTYTNYCDRKFQNDENLVGKLLEIGSIEDVVDINAAASSVSLSVTLDDTDGSIKSIYDYNDIHKVRVQVLQWFSNIPFTEAFTIFEGEISSPIVWTEGARNLKFDVITKLEDLEVGFSVEEGQFPFVPSSLIGKAWPVVFGRVAGLKTLSLTEPPSAILASGFGIVDTEIWDAELADLDQAILDAHNKSREAYQLSLNNAFIAGAFKPFGGDLPDDPDQAAQFDAASLDYYNQAIDFETEAIRLRLEREAKQEQYENQLATEFRVLPITQTNLPTGVLFTVEISNYTATAIVIGNSIVLTDLTEKVNINDKLGTNQYTFGVQTDEYKREFRGQKYVWIDGGTDIKVFNFPRKYIAGIGHLNVLNVWSRNKYGRAVVPRNWYVVQFVNYGPLAATIILFPTPLTSYPGEWQDGDIEIDCVSDIGPNVVEIMEWAITNFCSFTRDAASFNHVRTKVAAYPANFALTERKDVIRFLQEVAFQSRCAIWLNDQKFYLRYLPEKLTAVETLTDSDIEVDSVVVSSTPTERLVTKFVATWRERLNQSEPNKIIYRYNVRKYGILEEEYDFYIYNQYSLVAKSAEFWMIRKSNTWKIVTCKALLHKLRIETFDPVEFTFAEDLVATGSVTGVIQKSTFNPDDDTISIEAWLPVRLGEMTEYDFAQPMTVTRIYPVQSDPNVRTGNPYEEATGEIIAREFIPPNHAVAATQLVPYTWGRNEEIGDTNDTAPGTLITQLDPSEINAARPVGINNFNDEKKYVVKDVVPFKFTKTGPNAFYGEVVAVGDGIDVYKVNVWLQGLDHSPTTLNVRIGYIPEDDELIEGYPVVVYRTVWIDNDTNPNIDYWMQPPLWVPNS